jgi:phage-related baseplate assembly protein
VAFETLDNAYIISGRCDSSIVGAKCVTQGTPANGLDNSVLCSLDPAIDGVSVLNVSATEGGGDLETDTAYRERLSLSAARFGCGGSAKAYRYWALSASSLVADAMADRGAERGDIIVYIVAKDGEPSSELLEIVRDKLNQNDIKLIGDQIEAKAARQCHYSIRAEVTVFNTHEAEIILDKVRALASEYALSHSAKLGADVTPTQVLLALGPLRDGIYDINLIEPREIIEVGPAEWAACDEIDIRLAGQTNG